MIPPKGHMAGPLPGVHRLIHAQTAVHRGTDHRGRDGPTGHRLFQLPLGAGLRGLVASLISWLAGSRPAEHAARGGIGPSGPAPRQKAPYLRGLASVSSPRRWRGRPAAGKQPPGQSRRPLPGSTCAFGYARVSTDGQTLPAQDAALRGAGCAKVYSETASGAKTDRAALRKAVARLDEGDVLMVTRLDRLARSTRDQLNTLDEISKRGAGFKSLADTWADTTTPHGRLMLTVLGGLAEFERELIKSRTGEGRARAKAAGVHMGRPSKLSPHQQREAIARRDAGEALTDIARTFGVSHTTIGRLTAAPSS